MDKSKIDFDYKYEPDRKDYDPSAVDLWAYDQTKPFRSWQLNFPRGHGKNVALKKMLDSQNALAKAAKKAAEEMSTGLAALAKASEEIARTEYEAHCQAEEAVTEEKVAEFAEKYYLPLEYARDILITAYVDSILEEKGHHDTSESSAEADSVPDNHSKP